MNILLTCAGRRAFLVRTFQDAVKGAGRVIACDSDAGAPALSVADHAYVVPAIDDPNYVDALLRICRLASVGLLVPTMETELPLLAAHRERFLEAGTLPLVSSGEVVATCNDKIAMANFLKTLGIASPRTCTSLEDAREAVSSGELAFPLVVKPRWGMGSLGLEFCSDGDELEWSYQKVRRHVPRSIIARISADEPGKSVLIQECLSGTEYGFDLVNDFDGNPVTCFLRKKQRMRAGQTDRAVTARDPGLERTLMAVGKALRHVGMLDGDLMVTGKGVFVIDLNPRIGGGYPFSHAAGANVPAALVAWARHETPDPAWFRCRSDLLIARVDELIIGRAATTPADPADALKLDLA